MNRKVVVDIDGVLADFEGAFCKEFGHDNRELVSLEKRYPLRAKEITKYINDPISYKNLDLLLVGKQITDFLYNSGYEISLVTSRPMGCYYTTRDWLFRHRVNFFSLTVDPHKTSRIKAMKPLFAVDDLLSVQMALLVADIPTIIVSHPWNETSENKSQRISNINEFIASFTEITREDL